MKNKYKVVALVPLEFSVEGNSDSKEAIESKAGKNLLVSMSLNLSMTMFMFVPSGRRLRSFNTRCWSIKFVRI